MKLGIDIKWDVGRRNMFIELKDRNGHIWQADWAVERWRFEAVVYDIDNPIFIMFLFGLDPRSIHSMLMKIYSRLELVYDRK